jgi:hypothetical protein
VNVPRIVNNPSPPSSYAPSPSPYPPPPPLKLNGAVLTCARQFTAGIETPRELAEVLGLPTRTEVPASPPKKRAAEDSNGRDDQQKKTKATGIIPKALTLSVTKEKLAAKMKRIQRARDEYEEERRRRVEEERERERVERALQLWHVDEGVGDNE